MGDGTGFPDGAWSGTISGTYDQGVCHNNIVANEDVYTIVTTALLFATLAVYNLNMKKVKLHNYGFF